MSTCARAAQARQIEIYANTFTDDEQGINDIDQVLRERQITPSVIVHRGHSTHVERTLEKLPATAALVYLGNCGGHTLLDTVLRQAPMAHIITTRGIGTLTINDPLLKALNTYLLRGKDLTWQRFWRHLEATLGRHPRFMDYVPPDTNASVVFLRAYHRLTAAYKASRGMGSVMSPSVTEPPRAAALRYVDAEVSTCPQRRQVVSARPREGDAAWGNSWHCSALQPSGVLARRLLDVRIHHACGTRVQTEAWAQEQRGDDKGRA